MLDLQYIVWGLAKLVLAGLCGAAVGWDREAHEKAAGLRTHILMALGACLFALISIHLEADYDNVDVMRVVQGALMGTGFVCAGVIFRDGTHIRGLTTAAGLWIMGAVGLAIGLGYFTLGLFATALTFLAMAFLERGKRRIQKHEDMDGSGGTEGPPEDDGTTDENRGSD